MDDSVPIEFLLGKAQSRYYQKSAATPAAEFLNDRARIPQAIDSIQGHRQRHEQAEALLFHPASPLPRTPDKSQRQTRFAPSHSLPTLLSPHEVEVDPSQEIVHGFLRPKAFLSIQAEKAPSALDKGTELQRTRQRVKIEHESYKTFAKAMKPKLSEQTQRAQERIADLKYRNKHPYSSFGSESKLLERRRDREKQEEVEMSPTEFSGAAVNFPSKEIQEQQFQDKMRTQIQLRKRINASRKQTASELTQHTIKARKNRPSFKPQYQMDQAYLQKDPVRQVKVANDPQVSVSSGLPGKRSRKSQFPVNKPTTRLFGGGFRA